jgi:hypothetical protein
VPFLRLLVLHQKKGVSEGDQVHYLRRLQENGGMVLKRANYWKKGEQARAPRFLLDIH